MNDDLRDFSDAARQVVQGLGPQASEEQAWSLVAELGWLLTSIPEDCDGPGMGLPGACALLGELGRGVVPVPLLPALLAADALCSAEVPDRQAMLERLGSGEDYLAVSLAGSTLVGSEEENLTLSGVVEAVPSADRCKQILVWTASGDAVALVAVDQPGVELQYRETWDASRRLFDVRLQNVAVGPGDLIARGEAAAALLERILTWRDFALAAEAIGGAAALLEQTIEYLQTRRQFGRPLAMFQALKHRCADLQALVEAAEALLQDGLARVTGGGYEFLPGSDSRRAGQAAMFMACEAYSTVAEESLQLHGGIGMTAEHSCHRYLKRALLDEHLGRGRENYEIALADEMMASVARHSA